MTTKPIDYNRMTYDDEYEILKKIVVEEGSNILSIGNVYSELREHFNNEILDRWAQQEGLT